MPVQCGSGRAKHANDRTHDLSSVRNLARRCCTHDGRPQRFLNLLSLTAFSGSINNTEQGLRLLAGLAMIVRAEFSRLPGLFEIGGWFIILSSLILLVMPLRWHATYAI